ncbi:MBL fold metallo-hydrolase [Oceanobacillus damuensis]|uniref:MBL fold metallo-hydrolase n=1 Tax=Oceanobacillus damuensis TaxID=937928 RepID=UPI000AA81185|nr:hypothetical protein [Oceanobacillus damuensis]
MKEIKLTMLGTGSPIPTLERAASAQLLEMDEIPVLIDCGQETTSQLQRINVKP